MEYPGPWQYDEDNWAIHRYTDPDGGEIWCVFEDPPADGWLDWLLKKLNEEENQ